MGTDHTLNNVVATLALAVEALKEFHLQEIRETSRAPVIIVREAFGDSNTRHLLVLCQVGDTGDPPSVPGLGRQKEK